MPVSTKGFEKVSQASEKLNRHLKKQGLKLWGAGIGGGKGQFVIVVNCYNDSKETYERERLLVPTTWEGYAVKIRRVGQVTFQ